MILFLYPIWFEMNASILSLKLYLFVYEIHIMLSCFAVELVIIVMLQYRHQRNIPLVNKKGGAANNTEENTLIEYILEIQTF